MKSDLKNIATQQEVYYNGNYTFSTSFTDLQVVTSKGVTIISNEAEGGGWSAPNAVSTTGRRDHLE